MRVKTIIGVRLTILDAHYTLQDESTLLQTARKNFEGKNYKDMFIEQVVRVCPERSPPFKPYDAIPTYNYMDVRIEVVGLFYTQGEIIAGMEVKSISRETSINAIAVKDNITAIINFGNDVEENSIQVGLHVPIIVRKSACQPHQNSITIIGELWSPKQSPVIYSINNELGEQMTEALQFVVEQYASERERFKNIKGDLKDFFLTMFENGTNIESSDVPADPLTLEQGYYFVRMKKSGPVIARATNIGNLPCITVRKSEGQIMLLTALVSSYLLLNTSVEIYNTKEIIRQHAPLWQLFRNG